MGRYRSGCLWTSVEDNEPEQVKRVPELIALGYFTSPFQTRPHASKRKHTHPSGCRRTNLFDDHRLPKRHPEPESHYLDLSPNIFHIPVVLCLPLSFGALADTSSTGSDATRADGLDILHLSNGDREVLASVLPDHHRILDPNSTDRDILGERLQVDPRALSDSILVHELCGEIATRFDGQDHVVLQRSTDS
jgi:hypothetical protein